jgi:hypothetical protein
MANFLGEDSMTGGKKLLASGVNRNSKYECLFLNFIVALLH